MVSVRCWRKSKWHGEPFDFRLSSDSGRVVLTRRTPCRLMPPREWPWQEQHGAHTLIGGQTDARIMAGISNRGC